MGKNVLIIGGMGPQASLLLHQRIIQRACELGANNNDDFPAVTHLSVPVPDFIDSEAEKSRALDMIKQQIGYLWQGSFYTHGYSL